MRKVKDPQPDPGPERDPDPYLWLMDPDPDPGGPKTCGSCGSESGSGSGSGSPTLDESESTVYNLATPKNMEGEIYCLFCTNPTTSHRCSNHCPTYAAIDKQSCPNPLKKGRCFGCVVDHLTIYCRTYTLFIWTDISDSLKLLDHPKTKT